MLSICVAARYAVVSEKFVAEITVGGHKIKVLTFFFFVKVYGS